MRSNDDGGNENDIYGGISISYDGNDGNISGSMAVTVISANYHRGVIATICWPASPYLGVFSISKMKRCLIQYLYGDVTLISAANLMTRTVSAWSEEACLAADGLLANVAMKEMADDR